jgi:integrative and conjugative element protein (TIGR02256 family)
MIVVKDDVITLKIYKEVICKMKEYTQNDFGKPESGGILIGYYIEPNSFVITDISIPNVLDKASRYLFIRSKVNAQKFLNKKFKLSGGKKIYLGEWHTHPEKYPNPSSIDKKSIIRQLEENLLNSSTIFMFIVGISGLHISKVEHNKVSKVSNIIF